MAKDMKAMLAQKLAENSKRHAEAEQETAFDPGKQHVKLPIDKIEANPYQPRRIFPKDELASLASSISESGLLQPITVRASGARYQIIAGERRWRAHMMLGRHSIEALVMSADDGDMAILALAENIDRQALTDYEIGKALRQVENLFPNRTKLAESLGLARQDMYRYYAFEALPEHLRNRLDENPRLLSRTAASELKQLLQQTEHNALLLELLDDAWRLLESGELPQTKLAAHILRELKSRTAGTERGHTESHDVVHKGRVVGTMTQDERSVVLKLKGHTLTDEQRSKLLAFVDGLLSEESVSS
jgi:ParB family chromosome partitioning protein